MFAPKVSQLRWNSKFPKNILYGIIYERKLKLSAIRISWRFTCTEETVFIYFYVFTYGTFQIERRKDAITIVVDNVYLQLALFFFFSQLKILTNKELLSK